jgi:hypothetical protein
VILFLILNRLNSITKYHLILPAFHQAHVRAFVSRGSDAVCFLLNSVHSYYVLSDHEMGSSFAVLRRDLVRGSDFSLYHPPRLHIVQRKEQICGSPNEDPNSCILFRIVEAAIHEHTFCRSPILLYNHQVTEEALPHRL